LAVDFGEKRIGLAVAINDLAEPHSIIDSAVAVDEIVKICEQEKIEEILIGLPLDSEGQIGPAAQKVKKFGQRLSAATGLKTIFWDEALTSEEVLSKMIQTGRPQKKRRYLDDAAAALILQEYIDSRSSFAIPLRSFGASEGQAASED
jgi:putative Holliday junction resolvase